MHPLIQELQDLICVSPVKLNLSGWTRLHELIDILDTRLQQLDQAKDDLQDILAQW